MKHLLLATGPWNIVSGTVRLAEDATAAQVTEFNNMFRKAFSTTVMLISPSQIYLITFFKEPMGAWRALQNHFELDSLVNMLVLKKWYFRMEMKEGAFVQRAHLEIVA